MFICSLLKWGYSQKFIRCSRGILKNARKMQHVAYVRYVEDERFQLSIHIRDENVKVHREFNFTRKITESVDVLISRITTNVEKILNKKKKKKGNFEEGNLQKELDVKLMVPGGVVSGEKLCKDVLVVDNPVVIRIFDTDYVVVINAPYVSIITLPSSMMVNFPVYPSKFETLFTNQSDSTYQWYRVSKEKPSTECTEVGRGYFYIPSVRDIGHHLKLVCIPRDGEKEGPAYEVISKGLVEAGPGQCPFEIRHAFTSDRLEGQSFRVVSYNILAELYADTETARKELFAYCPQYALDMDYRKQLICKELLGYNGDILCLQEVDNKVFKLGLIPLLQSVGYEGVHEKKGGTVSEGVACFYHTSKFRLVETHSICLSEEISTNPLFAEIWEKIEENETFKTRFLPRTTSIQAVVLESVIDSNKLFVIGNTHLYFHPDADHIRLLQAGMCIKFIEYVVQDYSLKYPGKEISVIFCGDFNSTPEFGVYQLMTTQYIPEDIRDWKSNAEEAVKGLNLTHSLPLQSAYGAPEFTNFTVGFAGCLDYIFYQADRLKVTQIVPLPSIEEVTENTAIPSIVFPSDHVALVCDMTWEK